MKERFTQMQIMGILREAHERSNMALSGITPQKQLAMAA